MSYWPYQPEEVSGVNAMDDNGYTSLIRAVEHGDLVEVASLLKQGANPNLEAVRRPDDSRDPPVYRGFTALILARQKDNLPCAQLLLENGADPNGSALFSAVLTNGMKENYTVRPTDYCKSEAMRRLLIACGAQAREGEYKKRFGSNPLLHLAQ